ncbi:hypothetical protein KKF84_10555, partial [Myxococcota bacterium]|nr:hypothetical protein [Myxococcota bacterium]MBU1535752.1 hypothetical protein [Myxococcota bacterium]
SVIVGGGLILALLIVIAGALIIRGRRPNNRTKRLVPVEAPQPPPAMKQLTGKGPIEVKPLESAVPMSPVSASPMDPPVVYSLPFYLRVEPQGSAFSIRGAYQKEGNQYEIRVKGVNPTVVASHKGYHTKTVVISPKKDQIVVISLERITPHFVPMNEPRAGSSELLNPFSDRSNP